MPHKLLLADDSVTIQRVIELTFADEDVHVIAVGDGRLAIDRIQADRPDIVLADIGMPERDGYEVAAFVRAHPELAHVPVLLLTGAFEPVDEARARAAGCDGVLVKPFEPQMVISRVKELLAGGRPAPAWTPAPAAPSAAFTPADFDLNAAAPETNADENGDGSIEDYFDRLDAAFAGLDAVASAPSIEEPAALAAEVPAASEAEADVQTGGDDAGPDFDSDLDGGTVAPPLAVESAAMAPPNVAPAAPPSAPEPAAPIAPAVAAAAAAPAAAPVPAQVPVEAPAPAYAAPAPAVAPSGAAAAVFTAAPLPANNPFFGKPFSGDQTLSGYNPQAVRDTLTGRNVALGTDPATPRIPSLAEAFAALLAAEQRQPIAPAMIRPEHVPEATIEQVVRRVMDRMSAQYVKQAVFEVAERMVRDEIARIKRGS